MTGFLYWVTGFLISYQEWELTALTGRQGDRRSNQRLSGETSYYHSMVESHTTASKLISKPIPGERDLLPPTAYSDRSTAYRSEGDYQWIMNVNEASH